MKVQENGISISFRNMEGKADGTGKGKQQRSIFAGDLGDKDDKITRIRKTAQRKALKIVGDTFAEEQKTDNSVQEIKDHAISLKEQLSEELEKKRQSVERIEELEAKLQETHPATPEEEKDLQLLKKRNAAEMQGVEANFTEEENKRLAKLDEDGLTEYQKASLELSDKKMMAREKTLKMEKLERAIAADNDTVTKTRLERLKSSPMQKAEDAAREIEDAASKEIIGALKAEAKEHVDAQYDENKEKAEEAAEKKEKEQERIDSVKEKKAEQQKQTERIKEKIERDSAHLEGNGTEAVSVETAQNSTEAGGTQTKDVTEAVVKGDTAGKDIKQQLQQILDEMKLLSEDLKGAAVDENL